MALVYMKHKNADKDAPPAVTTDEAFEEVWKAKDWVLCDAAGKPTSSPDKAAADGAGAKGGEQS